MDFTIAIPTHNGASRLPLVLDRLRLQVDLETVTWEVIVIDNNSTDETKHIVKTYEQDFPCPLKYCFEPKQGAGYARKLAIKEAKSELIGFLDDDNIPDPNWIKAAIEFAQDHPQAGAIGSQIHPDFDQPPHPDLKPLLPYFAISEWGQKPFQYDRMLPPSAGLVVRRQAWIECVPEKTIETWVNHIPSLRLINKNDRSGSREYDERLPDPGYTKFPTWPDANTAMVHNHLLG